MADGQVGAAGEAVPVVRHGAKYAQADAADEADADDVAVTEASGPEVDVDARREDQVSGPRRGAREEREEEVGEEGMRRGRL